MPGWLPHGTLWAEDMIMRYYRPRPYRIVVFATRTRVRGKGKRQRTETIGYGYVSWNSDDVARRMYDPGRLYGSGTFCYPGMFAAYAAAMHELSKPEVHQISVRTNQDRPVYRYFKRPDGRITGYADREDSV